MSLLGRYFPPTPGRARIEAVGIGRAVGSVAPRQGGGLVCAVHKGFGLVSGQRELSLVDGVLGDRPHLRMNDGAVDARVRFWAGSMSLEHEAPPGEGTLYCLDPETCPERFDATRAAPARNRAEVCGAATRSRRQ
jgi:sugar lactone lactonase YvrE